MTDISRVNQEVSCFVVIPDMEISRDSCIFFIFNLSIFWIILNTYFPDG